MSRRLAKPTNFENQPEDSNEEDESEDDDYVPSEHEVSEEDNSGDDEDFNATDGATSGKTKKGKRRANTNSNNPRLARTKEVPDAESEELKKRIQEEQEASKEQKEKSRADALWASFMSDVTPSPKSKSTASKNTKESNGGASPISLNGATTSKPATVKITKVFDFAGEKVSLDKEVRADSKEAKQSSKQTEEESVKTMAGSKRPGGLGAVLGFINKKQKISTLDKSKLDWEKYKAEKGLTEELKNHTNSKNSYLDKKDFLERADHRQFEKERDARLATSSRR